MQSKLQSLKETMTNTFVGMAGSFGITMLCFQVLKEPVMISALATVLCTFWSIGRGYAIRRYFNSKQIIGEISK